MSGRVTYKKSRRRPMDVVTDIQATAREFAQKAEALAAEPTSTWKHAIDFAIDDVSSGGDLILNVHASGDNARIYRYVDEGTPTPRHAQMTRGFRPKTQVGSLAAGQGAGGLKRVSRDIFNPGIKARKFSKVVAEQLQPEFSRAIRKAISG